MVTKHRADLPVLCGCFPLAIYFTFGSVCMSMPLSHFVTAYPSPSPYPQVHALVGLCLYSRLTPRYFMTFFFFLRFHIYVLAYGICFSLPDLLYSVWQTLGPSTSLQITQFRFLLWLSNIPLYIWSLELDCMGLNSSYSTDNCVTGTCQPLWASVSASIKWG